MIIGLAVGNIFKPGEGMNIDPSTLDPSKIPGQNTRDRVRALRVRPDPGNPVVRVHRRRDPAGVVHLHRVRVRAEHVRRQGQTHRRLRQRPAGRHLQDRRLGDETGAVRHLRRACRGGRKLRCVQPGQPGHADPGLHRDLRHLRVRDPVADHAGLQAEPVRADPLPQDRTDHRAGHRVQRSGPAAADAEDGEPRRQQARRRHHHPGRVLLQPGRFRDLPDDGLAVPGPGGRYRPVLAAATGCWSAS